MPPPRPAHRARSARFFLAPDAETTVGERIDLLEGELEHATRVLRLGAGQEIEVLDGRGGRGRAELVGSGRRPDGARLLAPLDRTPLAGEPGSRLPHLELVLPPPRGARFEPLLDRLGQLGVAAIRPFLAEQTGPQDRASRRDRHLRVLREACKQSGNPQLPRLHEPASLAEAIAATPAPRFALAPDAAESLPAALSGAGSGEVRRLSLFVGPEGGFSPAELAALAAVAAAPVRIAAHILRIETAAEAASACVFAAAL